MHANDSSATDTVSLNHQAEPPTNLSFTITPVRTPSDLQATIELFTTYAISLNLDLSFQDFQNEMASLPGKYSPSTGGEILLARAAPAPSTRTSMSTSPDPGEALGCVALRSLSTHNASPHPRVCEMKRLYVTPGARGLGLGRALATQIIATAKSHGYSEMRLDTLPSQMAAQGMYRDLGFRDIEPYCFNPVEGARFLELSLMGEDVTNMVDKSG